MHLHAPFANNPSLCYFFVLWKPEIDIPLLKFSPCHIVCLDTNLEY
jgi:hypothetical protein